MTIKINEKGEIPLEYFKNLLDISKIFYYTLEVKDKILKVKFYDKNRKLLKPKEKT